MLDMSSLCGCDRSFIETVWSTQSVHLVLLAPSNVEGGNEII